MNKRIQELIAECEDFGTFERRVYTFDKEKFAELIAKECAQLCQNITDSDMFTGKQQYASAACRDAIQKHFGITL